MSSFFIVPTGLYKASYYQWKEKLKNMGPEGFKHGMTPAQLKRIRELEKEVCLGEKKEIIAKYILQGIKRDTAPKICK
jgi:putative transposase